MSKFPGDFFQASQIKKIVFSEKKRVQPHHYILGCINTDRDSRFFVNKTLSTYLCDWTILKRQLPFEQSIFRTLTNKPLISRSTTTFLYPPLPLCLAGSPFQATFSSIFGDIGYDRKAAIVRELSPIKPKFISKRNSIPLKVIESSAAVARLFLSLKNLGVVGGLIFSVLKMFPLLETNQK